MQPSVNGLFARNRESVNPKGGRLEIAIYSKGDTARRRNLWSVSLGDPLVKRDILCIPFAPMPSSASQCLSLSPIGALELLDVLKTPPPTAFVIPIPSPVIAPITTTATKTFIQIFCFLLMRLRGLYELCSLFLAIASFCFRFLPLGHTASSLWQC